MFAGARTAPGIVRNLSEDFKLCRIGTWSWQHLQDQVQLQQLATACDPPSPVQNECLGSRSQAEPWIAQSWSRGFQCREAVKQTLTASHGGKKQLFAISVLCDAFAVLFSYFASRLESNHSSFKNMLNLALLESPLAALLIRDAWQSPTWQRHAKAARTSRTIKSDHWLKSPKDFRGTT